MYEPVTFKMIYTDIEIIDHITVKRGLNRSEWLRQAIAEKIERDFQDRTLFPISTKDAA